MKKSPNREREDEALKRELMKAPLESVAIAAVYQPEQIAKRMEITLHQARRLHRAARQHVEELWRFYDAKGERAPVYPVFE